MKLVRPLAQLSILRYPDPVLRKRCLPIDQFDEQLAQLAARMIVLMHEAKGVGLAAPQVGLSVRLFVCNPTGESSDDVAWVNPVFKELTGAVEAEEGCLSIPGVNVPKRRAPRAVLEGQDLAGKPRRSDGVDLLARIWQHESDHLEGVLIIDGMSEVTEMANRRTLQQLAADYAASKR